MRWRCIVLVALWAATASGAPNLLPGDPRLEGHQHGHHGHGDHPHHGDHGAHHPHHADGEEHAGAVSQEHHAGAHGGNSGAGAAGQGHGSHSHHPPGHEHDGDDHHHHGEGHAAHVAADPAVSASEPVAATVQSGGVPDVTVSQGVSSVPARDPASGVPDLLISIAGSGNKATIDYGEGISITEQRPGQTGHHNPFNPDYRPTGEFAQASELFGGRPAATTRRTTRRPFTQRTTTRRTFSQRPTTRRPFTPRPTTRRTTRRPFFTQRPTTRRTTRRPFFTQRPTTRRTTRRPFPARPVSQNRPSNPFLSEQIDLSATNFQPSGPVTFRPQRPTAPPLVNTNPLGGPAGAKGPVVATCPGPATALPCVEEPQCDPYTGYLVSDGYKPPFPITKDTPTVAVVQCKLGGGRVGICCRRLPRPSTSTSLPLGTDYLEGLSTPRPRPGQKPSNIFLPNYKSRP